MSLAPYMKAVRGQQPLTPKTERELAIRARNGDAAAREELVRRHLGLVVAFALKQSRGAVRLDDLVQEGNLGLMRAAEKFNPDAGTRFASYATWWIRAYVWKYLKQARSAVRPQTGTVAREDVSLDAAIDEESDVTRLDRVEDEAPTPDEAVATSETDGRLRASLEKVRGRIGELGWDIIRTRLQQDPPDTLEQIGKRWQVSREWVRQVERTTKRFLLGYLEQARNEVESAAMAA
ncbi:sigma-70 family RNA polymerase sigma factor [Anaeromyxobacter terrae]|uniref:sigma-70 family RNA polymerase sigma factor n=1 Tax=Anaeromyxobacter terrae TaxID=2925406 RepID=UPI0038CC0794